LHEHSIDPLPELEADVAQHAHRLEAEALVHTLRTGVGAVSDHRHHLREAAVGAAADYLLEQRLADAVALHVSCDVDRIFHRVAIGRAAAVGARIGIADHLAILDGHQIGKAVRKHAGAP
jgi:hypothetical protein